MGTVKPFDKGKAQALYDAGWLVDEIAKDMKCSKETVEDSLSERNEKRRCPLEGLWHL